MAPVRGQRQEKTMTQLQDSRAERESFLALPFVLFRLPTDWLRAHPLWGRTICFTPANQTLISLEAASRTHVE